MRQGKGGNARNEERKGGDKRGKGKGSEGEGTVAHFLQFNHWLGVSVYVFWSTRYTVDRVRHTPVINCRPCSNLHITFYLLFLNGWLLMVSPLLRDVSK